MFGGHLFKQAMCEGLELHVQLWPSRSVMAYSGGPSSDIKFTVDAFDIADANYLGKEVTVVRLRNRVLSVANFTAKKEIHAIDA
jgi:hypothetical protein